MNPDSRPELKPLSPQPDELDSATSEMANKVRQGVTGHNVRYVLLFGIAGVVLAFIFVYVAFFG